MTRPERNQEIVTVDVALACRSRCRLTGTLSLLVPMDGEGTFKTELFDRYQRSEKALVLSLMEMYRGA